MKIYMSTNSSVNFKHENSFLKLLLKTAKIRHFWYQILFKKTQISLFFPKFKKFYFSTLTNLRTLISNELIIFQNYSPKVPKKGIFDTKFEGSLFWMNFRISTYSRVLILNMTTVSFKFQSKLPK